AFIVALFIAPSVASPCAPALAISNRRDTNPAPGSPPVLLAAPPSFRNRTNFQALVAAAGSCDPGTFFCAPSFCCTDGGVCVWLTP
ncbi:uncharacterized protein EI90DRAFT_3080676, partial [Cantharellus anzutake]|uniref:uncharacterized protein n=1 Tax=Cantharellus anzutake TaxID=1750568 RepID=UPI001907D68D